MTYQVTVAVSHPAHAPYSVTREGPESHSLQSISDTLLQAVSDAQRHLGIEKTTMAELVASRGTFQALSGTLDEFEVATPPNEGMLGLVQRVRMLGDEVRRLRLNTDGATAIASGYQEIVRTLEAQRDRVRQKADTSARQLGDVRNALNAPAGTGNEELAWIVGVLQSKHERLLESLRHSTETIGEVRAGLGAGREVFDSQLGELARAARVGNVDGVGFSVPTGLLPVTAEEMARAIHAAVQADLDASPDSESLARESWEESPAKWNAWRVRVAQGVLDRLPSFAAPKRSSLQVTPMQLARAMHTARSTLTNTGGLPRPVLFAPVLWEQQGPREQEWFTRVAELALSELPQIARVDAELRHEVASLRDDLAHVEVERDELHDEKVTALQALRDIAGVLSMSFGAADDAGALGMLTVEGVRQLKAEKARLSDELGLADQRADGYRSMVLSVAELLGIPESRVNAVGAFGESFREAIQWRATAVEALTDALINLRDMPGVALQGRFIARDAADAIRQLRRMLDVERARLDVTSVTAEWLAQAWYEADLSPSLPLWGELLDLHESYTRHAERVIKALNSPQWTALARRLRKPGVFFMRDEAGDLMQGKAFKVDDAPVAARRAQFSKEDLDAAFGEGLAADASGAGQIARVISDLSGGKIIAAAADQDSVLSQLREQGEALRERETRSRKHHKLIAEALGMEESASPARLAERAQELRDEVSRLQIGHDDFRRKMSAALGGAPMTPDDLLRAKARDAADAAWVHQFCGPNAQGSAAAKALVREMAATLGLEPSAPQGGEWPWVHLLSRVAELVRDRQNVLSVVRDHCDDLREALQVKSVGWGELMADARSRSATLEETRRMLVDARRTVTERSEDLSRALGFSSGESWEDMIEFVTGRTSDHGMVMMERNAFAEIRRTMGLPDKQFPAGVVDAVRDLRGSWGVMEEWYPRVVEALGVTHDTTTDENIPTAVGKALDKIGELQKLRESVIIPGASAEVRRIKDAVETLLEAAGVDLDGDFTRPDVTVQKAGDAAAILRSWPDVARAAEEMDLQEVANLADMPDEVAPVLRYHLDRFREQERYVAVVSSLEGVLASLRGETFRPDLSTLAERFNELVRRLFSVAEETGHMFGLKYDPAVGSMMPFAVDVLMRVRNYVALSPAPMWASWAEQVAARLEGMSRNGVDPGKPDFVVRIDNPPLHRHTLREAAIVVRAHSAALVSGEHPHPLVLALRSATFWAPEVGDSKLEVFPYEGGDVLLRDETLGGGSIALESGELAPVGAALLALSFHQVREAGLKRQREASADAEEISPIRVTPRMPQEWSYGPTAIDSDPGKRWHTGCGGEVLTFDGVDVCGDCKYEWEPEAGVVTDADEPDQDPAP